MSYHLYFITFCMFYFLFFTSILSITPLGTFPPPPLIFTFPAIVFGPVTVVGATEYTVQWAELAGLVIGAMLLIVIAVNLANVQVAGSGINIDAKQISTIIVGGIMSGLLGSTLNMMLPADMPIIVSLIFIWPFIGLLAYSIIVEAGKG